MVSTYVHWALWAVAFHFFISQVTCNVDSIGPDDDGQCGKYKISCPLGKICRVRKIYWPRKVQYPICVLRDTPVENRFTCTLPPAPGKCLGRFLRWYYNTHSGQCSFFYYSGCQGNDNMFMRREDCEQTCLGLGELVIPPEATVLPPVDPLMATVGPNNLELVDVSAITKKDRRGRKHRKNRKDKKRRGKKRRNRRLQRYQSLRGAKTSFVPAQKDAPNKKTETVNSRVLPTSLRKSIASGRYFRIFTILSRRHGNNVYRYNRSRSHRRRKHRNRSTTSLPPVAPPTTPIV